MIRTYCAFLFVCALLLCCGAGCQSPSARFVQKGADEGTVAMAVDNEANRAKAHELMQAHFPDGYEITWEEEAKVGTSTVVHDHSRLQHHPGMIPSAEAVTEFDVARQSALNRAQDHPGSPPPNMNVGLGGVGPGVIRNSQGTIDTVDRTEWRISYRRQRGGRGELTRAVPELTQGVTQADAETEAAP